MSEDERVFIDYRADRSAPIVRCARHEFVGNVPCRRCEANRKRRASRPAETEAES